MKEPNDWNPQETLFAFMGWLTCRVERSTFSAMDDASPAVRLIKQFSERHDLKDVREGWSDLIRMSGNDLVNNPLEGLRT